MFQGPAKKHGWYKIASPSLAAHILLSVPQHIRYYSIEFQNSKNKSQATGGPRPCLQNLVVNNTPKEDKYRKKALLFNQVIIAKT